MNIAARAVAAICLVVPGKALAQGCSAFLVEDSGALLLGDATCTDADGANGGNLRAGHAAPGLTGTVEVTGGADVTLERSPTGPVNDRDPFFVLGRNAGEVGTGLISGAGSTVTLNAGNTAASVQIGREGTGSLTIQGSGVLQVLDPTAAPGSGATAGESVIVGTRGGTGTLTLSTGVLTVDGGSGAFLHIGDRGGVGAVNVTDTSTVTLRDREAGVASIGSTITVGRDTQGGQGGNGTLLVRDSDVSVTSDTNFAGLFVGREAGTTGAATITGATTSFALDGGSGASIVVGRDGGSSGTLTVTDGAQVTINSDRSILDLGRSAGATGGMVISGGADVSVSATVAAEADLLLGFAFAGKPTGGAGSLLVTGAGSTLTVGDNIIVGAPLAFGGGSSSGLLTVSNGGEVTANNVFIGAGGVLTGAGGALNANVTLDGGVVAPGSSPGTLVINGDFTVMSGVLELEIAGTGPGEFDFLDISGAFIADSGLELALVFLDDFVPDEGTSFNFIEVAGDATALETLFAQNLVTVSVQGLGAGSVFDLAFENGVLSTTATVVMNAVPLPATAPLLLGAVGFFGLIRRRRLSRARAA